MAEGKIKKGKILLSWEIEEETKRNINLLWIIVFFVLIVGALVYAILTSEWLMGAVFITLIIAFGWYLFGKQQSFVISITKNGVGMGTQFYNFEKIRGYWASEENKTIYLLPKFKGSITIALPVKKYKINDIIKLFPSSLNKVESEGKDVIDRISGLLKK